MDYDFCGWATRNDVLCSDGRIIMQDAFKHNDGDIVPLVWNHKHNSPETVLGKGLLENRPEGVYVYGKFNDTKAGRDAKLLVEHGDVSSLSIFANQLTEQGRNVVHGMIREVSLVLAGANPEASIEDVIEHGELTDGAVICMNRALTLYHADAPDEDTNKKEEEPVAETNDERTVQDVIDTMNEEQKNVLYGLLGLAVSGDEEEDETEMKHNVFENDPGEVLGGGYYDSPRLTHSQEETIIRDAERSYKSMRDSFLAHADEYGIENIDYLFPDYQTLSTTPEFDSRDMGWVAKVMNGVRHSPFSRIKTVSADITEDEARAKGYIKGNMKKEEFFTLAKRTTDPTTIYKKQKIDRDDRIDITDFDVIAWIKTEMRMMLDEEIARAILVGDGRYMDDDDKIDESKIRPIWKDSPVYSINATISIAPTATSDEKARAFIRQVIKSRKDYRGSGTPTLFTTEDMLTDMLLLTDENGRDLYDSEEKLRTKLRVGSIVTVPVMENCIREVNGKGRTLAGIVVNLDDYNVGADKGGSINMFEDFDIDYNQEKYLIETRCSGALRKLHSAIVLEFEDGNKELTLVVKEPSGQHLGKNATDLQKNIKISGTRISGELEYVTKFTAFSSNPKLQNGNYLMLQFDAPNEDGVVQYATVVQPDGTSISGSVKLDSDETVVARIINNDSRIKIESTYGTQSITKYYSLGGLTLKTPEE